MAPFVGGVDRRRRSRARPRRAPTRRPARRRSASGPARFAPAARRRARPPRAASGARVAVALGPRQRRLDQQQVGAGGEVARASWLGAQSAENVNRAPSSANSTALAGMKCGTGWKRTRQPADRRACRPGRRPSRRRRARCARRVIPVAATRRSLANASGAQPGGRDQCPGAATGRLLARRVAQRRTRTGRGRGCGRRAGG